MVDPWVANDLTGRFAAAMEERGKEATSNVKYVKNTGQVPTFVKGRRQFCRA